MLLGHNNNFNRVNNKCSLYHQFIVIACFLRLALIQLTNAVSVNFPQFPRDANIENTYRYDDSVDPSISVITPTSRFQVINKTAEMPPTIKSNLTAVTWAHAVNSQDQLTDALNSTVDMIETDIVMGKINDTGPDIPVMAHPPAKSSDLSLDSFLQQIRQHNEENVKQMKGIKLDFKSIEVFEGSLHILEETVPQMTYPIWLNADIVSGPVNQTTTVPVDPKLFFDGCYQFQNVVLSIGWTTKWSSEPNDGYYTPEETEAMETAIRSNYITESGQPITFPVRAGIAANSSTELYNLLADLQDTNECTLTIWSSQNDYVDIGRLHDFIFLFGLDRVYLDVPEELHRQLHLSRTDDDDDATEGGKGGVRTTITSLLNFSLMSAGIYLLSLFLERLRV